MKSLKSILLTAILAGGMLMAGSANAWFGGWAPWDWFDDDDWRDYPPPWYYGAYPGYGAPYGYGYPPAYGYGAPYYGYGAPYGYGGYPYGGYGYGYPYGPPTPPAPPVAPQAPQPAPDAGSSSK